jgi:hypothetical protein
LKVTSDDVSSIEVVLHHYRDVLDGRVKRMHSSRDLVVEENMG